MKYEVLTPLQGFAKDERGKSTTTPVGAVIDIAADYKGLAALIAAGSIRPFTPPDPAVAAETTRQTLLKLATNHQLSPSPDATIVKLCELIAAGHAPAGPAKALDRLNKQELLAHARALEIPDAELTDPDQNDGFKTKANLIALIEAHS